jgi:hypothetical protein
MFINTFSFENRLRELLIGMNAVIKHTDKTRIKPLNDNIFGGQREKIKNSK